MPATRRPRRRQLEPAESPGKPIRYHGTSVSIKPTMYAVCAVCFWSHATISLNDNAYHKPCIDELMREYHATPANLMKEGQA